MLYTKSFSSEASDSAGPLKRVLGPIDLTMLGIGGIVGAGIFALVGEAAAGKGTTPGAGPALMISFVLTAIACGFAALCYAEFASLAHVSGSAYSYAYATLGELVAWIIGWDLLLEYAVGNVAVAISWSGYFQDLINPFLPRRSTISFVPEFLRSFPCGWEPTCDRELIDANSVKDKLGILDSAPRILGAHRFQFAGGAHRGRDHGPASDRHQGASIRSLVGIKLLALAFFVIVGSFYMRPENFHPFMPNGWAGVQAGAALVFFAYIGFDAVSTAAEECRNPKRDLPIGILVSLAICTVIYIVVGIVLTGMCYYTTFRDKPEPLSVAMRSVHLGWAAGVISLGSVIAHTAVLLVFQLGQPRILYAMSCEWLAAKVHGTNASTVSDAPRGYDSHRNLRSGSVSILQSF